MSDLDIIIYPRTTEHFNSSEIHDLLCSSGFNLLLSRVALQAIWNNKGSDDAKFVQAYTYLNKRVDVFSLK